MTSISVWKHRFFILYRIVLRNLYKLLGKANASLQPQQLFCIKKGYHHASRAESFDDTVNLNDDYQRSVYELAASLSQKHQVQTVLDVGCGSAFKAMNLLRAYDYTGIEVEPTYSWLQKNYPDGQWLLFDTCNPSLISADIVICSDVIEHIENPDEMMNFLARLHFKYLILSTPERDAMRGKRDYGPPENTSHYREWNKEEFNNYVSKWFAIHDHQVFDDESITQVVVCKTG